MRPYGDLIRSVHGLGYRLGEPPPHLPERSISALSRSANVQRRLIDDLVDTSRIVTGKLVIEKTPFDLVPAVHALNASQRLEAEKRGIKIEWKHQESAWVLGDPQRMTQILANLLSNAITFSGPGQTVTVTLEKLNEQIQVTVSDQGTGIDPAFIPFVFDRFRQESRGTNRTHHGLGLGLAIAKYLTEAQSGQITVHSKGKGQGARFELTFPLVQQQTLAPPSPCPPAHPQGLTNKKILVIDDAEEILRLLAFWIRENKGVPMLAHSVNEAFAAPSKERPDVVFCDIGMPDQDGFEYIHQLRSHPEPQLRTLPVVALTAYTKDSECQSMLRAGFDRHLKKPVDEEELIQTTLELCGSLDN